MLPDRADEMLRNYKSYLGRCGHIKTLIDELKREAILMQIEARDDLLNSSGKQLDGMPRGTTVGNPTERVALMLVLGYVPDGVAEIQAEIAKLEAEYRQKNIVVLLVEAWLRGLTEKEKWMIERCIFDGMTYRQINAMYRQVYGECCSKDSLQRLKKTALTKIYEMAR
jgi:hypothetical protein